jgi:hypothetical protein
MNKVKAAVVSAFCTAIILISQMAHAEPLYANNSVSNAGKIELAYQALHLADWLQTLTIARNPDQFYETNKVLGSHPGVAEVNQYFLVTGIGHALISHFLPLKATQVWQGATIVMQVGYVTNNHDLGIGFNVKY